MKAIERQLAEKYGNRLLYSVTMLRPVHVNGSGKWSRNYRSSKVDAQIKELKASGLFHHETGNDSPRGGLAGEFHRFTPKVKRLSLKRSDEKKAEEQTKRNREISALCRISNAMKRKQVRQLLRSGGDERSYLLRKIEQANGNRSQKFQTGCYFFGCKYGFSHSIVKDVARAEFY